LLVTISGTGPLPSVGETLADPLADRRHLELGARDLVEQLVGGRPLADRPELAEQIAGVAPREPVVAELGPPEVPQLRLERPGSQVARDVERPVDVVEIALRVRG